MSFAPGDCAQSHVQRGNLLKPAMSYPLDAMGGILVEPSPVLSMNLGRRVYNQVIISIFYFYLSSRSLD